jgi:putative ABC transport system permease protein
MVAKQMSRRVASAAVRVYAAALIVLPVRLRARYGLEMRAVFERRCGDTAGSLPVAILLLRELADLFRAAVDSRRAPGHPLTGVTAHPSAMSSLDFRYALRMLHRQPSFTAVAVLTLGLGIGATTAVFTVVNGVLLRPLPYAEPDRLVQLLHGRNGRLTGTFSPPNFRDVTAGSGVFSGAAALTPSSANVTGIGEPRLVDGANVTSTFFEVLGVRMRMGRGLVGADGDGGGAAVVVVRESLWRGLFGARPDIVGSTVVMDGRPFTIVGVAPDELASPAGAEYWRPLVWKPGDIADTARGAQWVGAIARLKPGVSVKQAKSAMAVVAERLSREFPRTNKDRVMTAIQLHERMVRGIRPTLLMLFGAVALVLLMACVNVANLLLARANGRAREVAVRAAVGAGRGRLVRQFLVESVTLGVLGAAAGLGAAYAATRALVAMGPASIPRLSEVAIDWHVLAFTVGVAVGTSIAFGLIPALAATSRGAMHVGGRGVVGAAGTRTRKALVIAEMALAVVLLAGAGLLIRSYQRISAVNPGFSADHLLTFNVALPEQRYPTSAAAGRFMQALVGRLASHPGVEHAGAVYGLPLDDTFAAHSSFTRAGEADSSDTPSAGMRIVTPDYFATMRIAVRSGRAFDAHDDERGAEAVVVNEEAARRYWPGQNPIGQQLHLSVRLADAPSGMKTIVGVVGDVKYGGLDATAAPEVYVPYAQHQVDSLTFVVRTTDSPEGLIPAARADVAAIDRDVPLAGVKTMDEVVGRSIAERRFTMLLLAAFATVAVLLAAVGVYGVLAYLVTQRTQEIGVRLAMGASPADVVRLFLREGAAVSATGLVAGFAGAVAAARALQSLVFGVTTTDPVTFAGVATALAVVAFLASYVPARRAARVDPAVALRAD